MIIEICMDHFLWAMWITFILPNTSLAINIFISLLYVHVHILFQKIDF